MSYWTMIVISLMLANLGYLMHSLMYEDYNPMESLHAIAVGVCVFDLVMTYVYNIPVPF